MEESEKSFIIASINLDNIYFKKIDREEEKKAERKARGR